MRKRNILMSLIMLAISASMALAAVGCQPETLPKPEVAPNPFTEVWGSGEEYIVTFSGDSAGHLAGEESEFTLKLNNNSTDPWKVEYIVQLLDTDSIVMEIAHDTTNVLSGLEQQIDIRAVFDKNLEGPYGLSLYIPTYEAQSLQTIWIGDKEPVNVGPWPSIADHPWLWPEIVRKTAEDFVKNSPTYTFDGIEESLELVETLYPDIKNAWQFVFQFESRHAGYGDRMGEMLAQVITPHQVVITVEKGQVKLALMDGVWNMIAQETVEDNAAETETQF